MYFQICLVMHNIFSYRHSWESSSSPSSAISAITITRMQISGQQRLFPTLAETKRRRRKRRTLMIREEDWSWWAATSSSGRGGSRRKIHWKDISAYRNNIKQGNNKLIYLFKALLISTGCKVSESETQNLSSSNWTKDNSSYLASF